MDVCGSISYASQEPWLFPSSIKQNILFGEEFDQKRYEEVIRICALEYDLSLFENGDETVVADRGQNLSKGQQSRINLARAIYRKSDIYLLDDSLTALDGHVQDYIFNECVMKFLKDKICVLVSQNYKHIDRADKVVVLKNGTVMFTGNSKDINEETVDGFTAIKNKENEERNKICDEKFPVIQTEQQQSKINVYHEVKKTGKVAFGVYKKYIQLGGGFIVFCLVILLYVITQVCESSADKLLTKW